jgi:UrcA family protein
MRPSVMTSWLVPAALLLSPLCPADTRADAQISAGTEAVTRAVRFADLNLAKDAGIATLYRRIKTAAQNVCEPDRSGRKDAMVDSRRCQKRAIEQAVKDVHSTELTRMHMNLTNNQVQIAMIQP